MGGREKQGFFYHADCLLFLWEMVKVHRIGYLISIDQKISGWLIKIMLLREVEAAVRSGIKSQFDILGFSTNEAILWFSL